MKRYNWRILIPTPNGHYRSIWIRQQRIPFFHMYDRLPPGSQIQIREERRKRHKRPVAPTPFEQALDKYLS
jgi:hypothetical protein